jgi:N-acetylglucosaminyl-diphospho-decaprenol L-rhamnosyltransferase
MSSEPGEAHASADPAAGAGDAGDAPDVSVIVVNYNSGHYLERCLRSIADAGGDARVEIVAVDNASRDGSEDRALAAVPEARLIRNERNLGFGAAANVGMRASSAPFVFLLNPDAVIAGGTLGGFLKVAAAHPRAGVIGCLTRNPDGSIYPSARRIPGPAVSLGHMFVGPFVPNNRWSRAYTMSDWDRLSERRVEWASGSSMLLRVEALRQVGHFDEDYFMYVEDVDLCTRMRNAGWEVWYSPELEVEHVVGTSTRGSKRMTLEHSKSIYRYYAKHRSPGWRAITRPAVWAGVRARAALVSRRRGDR